MQTVMGKPETNNFLLDDNEYPIICDLIVLEKIQQKTGDIIKAEDLLRGFVPRVDSDGVIDRTVGTWTIPDIDLVTFTLAAMIEEGREVTGGDGSIPTTDDLKRQSEYGITELAKIVWEPFENCIAGPVKKKSATRKTATKMTSRR